MVKALKLYKINQTIRKHDSSLMCIYVQSRSNTPSSHTSSPQRAKTGANTAQSASRCTGGGERQQHEQPNGHFEPDHEQHVSTTPMQRLPGVSPFPPPLTTDTCEVDPCLHVVARRVWGCPPPGCAPRPAVALRLDVCDRGRVLPDDVARCAAFASSDVRAKATASSGEVADLPRSARGGRGGLNGYHYILTRPLTFHIAPRHYPSSMADTPLHHTPPWRGHERAGSTQKINSITICSTML
jgi:hypothetical protein